MNERDPVEVDLRLRSPFTALVASPTGSGKTVFLLELRRNASRVAAPAPAKIVYCYGMWQKSFEGVTGVTFREGLPDVREEFPADGENRWLVIDDLMDELSGRGELNALFTKQSHHINISVFFVVQNLFHKGLRQVSLNSHYMFLFYNPRDVSTVQNLGRQLYPTNPNFLLRAYEEATSAPYSHLFLDLTQKADRRSRVRAGFAGLRGKMVAFAEKRRRGRERV